MTGELALHTHDHPIDISLALCALMVMAAILLIIANWPPKRLK